MPEKDPFTYSFITYLWVIGLSSWGGIASYVRKVRGSIIARFSIVELIGELAISAFVGVITFYLCNYAELDPALTAALVGVSGHMGSRAIFNIERVVQQRIGGEINNER